MEVSPQRGSSDSEMQVPAVPPPPDSSEQARCIEDLGPDQVLTILQLLPATTIVSFGMTCHRFYDIANSDALWSKVCRREWGDGVVEAWPKLLGRRRKLGWKELFGQMLFCGAVAWHQLNQGNEDEVPPSRASHSMNHVSGNVTVFGGGHEGGRTLDDTWTACVQSNLFQGVQWQRENTGIYPGRFGHSCVAADDMLVLFGGISENGSRNADTWIKPCRQEGSAWQLLDIAESPLPRGAHASCYAGCKKVVVFGGIRPDGVRLQDTWILDLSLDRPAWQNISTQVSPAARSGHTLTGIGRQRVILFGGRGAKFEVLNDVWVLDLSAEFPAWVELRAAEAGCEAPPPRAGHSSSVIFGNRVLIFGGEDSKRSKKADVWVLDPEAAVPCSSSLVISSSRCSSRYARKFWKRLKVRGQAPNRRSFHAACSLESGHGVLVFGGMVDLAPPSAGTVFNSELFFLQLIP